MPNTQRVAALSPVFGMRFYNRDDLAPRGFSDAELAKTYAALADSNHNLDMLLESASFEEVDSYLNPGIDPVDESFILEAIVVDKFSKTEHRMKAVVRTLNRHLADSGISALDPQIGTPRKSGGWAYVTVQSPSLSFFMPLRGISGVFRKMTRLSHSAGCSTAGISRMSLPQKMGVRSRLRPWRSESLSWS